MDSCKVYIHDLEVRSEIGLRQKLLRSSVAGVTRIRFVTDMNLADIWILEQGSAFLQQATQAMKAGKIRLWLHNSGALTDLSRNNDCKTCNKIITDLSHTVLTEARYEHKHGHISALQHGMRRGVGCAYLLIGNGVMFFNFAHKTVRYNKAALALLDAKEALPDTTKIKVLSQLSVQTQLDFTENAVLGCWRLSQVLTKTDGLLEPLTEDTVVKISHWPDFGAICGFDDYRLASVLQKRAFSIAYVSKLLRLETPQVYAFINAAYLSGLLRIEAQAVPAQAAAPKTENNLLAGLWKKVRQMVS